MRTLTLLLVTAVLAACPNNDDDCDAGTSSEGEGEAGEGEGEGESAGEGEGEGEGEEGEGELPICDGGICPDAGIAAQVYVGTEEDGTVCGGDLCSGDVEPICCVTATLSSIDGKCVADPPDECAGGVLNATFRCDGPEDCAAGEECCLHQDITTSCVLLGACQSDPNTTDSVVCVNDDDCLVGELCCGLNVAFDVPVDMGTCTNEEDNCEF